MLKHGPNHHSHDHGQPQQIANCEAETHIDLDSTGLAKVPTAHEKAPLG
jgi:hypothetical protein